MTSPNRRNFINRVALRIGIVGNVGNRKSFVKNAQISMIRAKLKPAKVMPKAGFQR